VSCGCDDDLCTDAKHLSSWSLVEFGCALLMDELRSLGLVMNDVSIKLSVVCDIGDSDGTELRFDRFNGGKFNTDANGSSRNDDVRRRGMDFDFLLLALLID